MARQTETLPEGWSGAAGLIRRRALASIEICSCVAARGAFSCSKKVRGGLVAAVRRVRFDCSTGRVCRARKEGER